MDFALEELLKHALRLTRAVPGSGYDCDGNLIGWEKSLEDKLNENGCDHLTYSMAKYYHYQKKGKKRFDEWLYFIPRLNSEEDDDERHDDLGFLRRTKIPNYLLMLFCLFLIAFLFFCSLLATQTHEALPTHPFQEWRFGIWLTGHLSLELHRAQNVQLCLREEL